MTSTTSFRAARIANGNDTASEEVFAGIKLLVAVAQADGVLHPAERLAIENALEGASLPMGTSIAALLESPVDVDYEVSRIRSDEARQRTLAAAWAMVHVDGELSHEEDVLITRIAAGLGFSVAARTASMKTNRYAMPSLTARADNVRHREVATRAEIAKASAFSAALTVARMPGGADACAFTNNVRLARNIGMLHGHDVDESFWRTFVQNLIGASAPWSAISSLMQLLPGTNRNRELAYATTYAVGQATSLYAQSRVSMNPDMLLALYRVEKEDGLVAARAAENEIAICVERLERALLDAALEDVRKSA